MRVLTRSVGYKQPSIRHTQGTLARPTHLPLLNPSPPIPYFPLRLFSFLSFLPFLSFTVSNMPLQTGDPQQTDDSATTVQ
ncbi:unnamed protein product [Hymenolepis diminuta]|uniref:Uncharacterized protein n=1 Tax=Hymenolepis diminuta TaxID=6216 RepID=A0A564YVT7_HYMDI|nr:unnamed protein product [Hymenolepis diminuta]